jgi:hypothetical protein
MGMRFFPLSGLGLAVFLAVFHLKISSHEHMSGVRTNGNVLYVSLEGNDALAERNRLDRPWLTWSNAIARAEPGDTIQIGPGEWHVAAMRNQFWGPGLGPVPVNSKTNLVIQGAGSTTILHAPGNGDVFPVWNSSNLVFRKFAVEGSRQNITDLYGVFLLLGTNSHLVFEQLELREFPDHGIYVENNGFNRSDSVWVRDCHFESWGSSYPGMPNVMADGAAILPGGFHWFIERNVFRRGMRGIEPWGRFAPNAYGDIWIRNNVFEELFWQGIVNPGEAEDARGFYIIDNTFRNFFVPPDQEGYLTNAEDIAAIWLESGSDFLIEGNLIENISGWPGQPNNQGMGIVFADGRAVERAVIRSNTVINCKSSGISLSDFGNYWISNVVIQGNTILRTGGSGIDIFGGFNHTILGNDVRETAQLNRDRAQIAVRGGAGHRLLWNRTEPVSGEPQPVPDLIVEGSATNTIVAGNAIRNLVDQGIGTVFHEDLDLIWIFAAQPRDQIQLRIEEASSAVGQRIALYGPDNTLLVNQTSKAGSPLIFNVAEAGSYLALAHDGLTDTPRDRLRFDAQAGPLLKIEPLHPNQIAISWPSEAKAELQKRTDASSANWLPISEPIYDNGTNCVIWLEAVEPLQFFRLLRTTDDGLP